MIAALFTVLGLLKQALVANKDAIDALQSLVTIGAFFVGGIWAWRRYRRERDQSPKARIKHDSWSWNASPDFWVLRVHVRIENVSRVLLNAKECEMRLYRLDQLPMKALSNASPSELDFHSDGQELNWPLLEEPRTAWHPLSIEPGEADDAPYDFRIPVDVERVLIYTYVGLSKTAGKGLGWNTYTVVDRPTEGRMSVHKELSGGDGMMAIEERQGTKKPLPSGPNRPAPTPPKK